MLAGDEVVVFENASRLGGQLWTERTEGFVVEHGAEGFVARSEAVPILARSLGIDGDLVDQRVSRSFGYDGSELRELAPGEAASFLGFQVPREEMGRGIRTFRRGMGQVVEFLEAAVRGRADLRASTRVLAVEPHSDGASVRVEGTGVERFDALVVATGAVAASRLLSHAVPAARRLEASSALSSVTVTLAFARAQLNHPLDGTGFVVAEGHQTFGFRATTFITSKFAERAPDDVTTIRLFFRPQGDDAEVLDDAAWAARAEACLARVIQLRGTFLRAWVSRWVHALPVFDPGHRECVRALEAGLSGSRLRLAGSAFHGSGIDAAVRSAEAASLACG